LDFVPYLRTSIANCRRLFLHGLIHHFPTLRLYPIATPTVTFVSNLLYQKYPGTFFKNFCLFRRQGDFQGLLYGAWSDVSRLHAWLLCSPIN
jgi:hypothetical protein